MGSINLKHTGSGSAIALSSDGTSLLLDGTAIGGGSANAVATTTVPVSGQTNNFTIAIGNDVLTSVDANKSSNLGIGDGALELATDSRTTVAVGNNALRNNGTAAFGWQNTAIGVSAGANVTGGYDHIFMGYNCGGAIAGGQGNIVIGAEAYLNKTGNNFQYNVVIGHKAGWGASSGSTSPQGQILIGQRAGSNSSGGIVAIGDYAAVSGTGGSASIAIGNSALRNSGYIRNTAIGDRALMTADATAQQNTAIGYYALKDLTSGDNNVAVGNQTLESTTTGSYNTVVGDLAGYNQSTPSSNTLIGRYAGGLITTGSKNTLLGRFNGNQGGLDIRTSSNNIVLSDGDGNVRWRSDSNSDIFTGLFSSTGATEGFYYQPQYGITYSSRSGTSTKNHRYFVNANGTVGSIATSGSSTSYNTSSDHRLKENVSYTWDATTRLKQLKPARFNFIVDPDTTVDGFLAHEAQAVVPEAVHGTHNEVDADGNAVMQGIDQSKLVPLLVKTIQELEARITALEGA